MLQIQRISFVFVLSFSAEFIKKTWIISLLVKNAFAILKLRCTLVNVRPFQNWTVFYTSLFPTIQAFELVLKRLECGSSSKKEGTQSEQRRKSSEDHVPQSLRQMDQWGTLDSHDSLVRHNMIAYAQDEAQEHHQTYCQNHWPQSRTFRYLRFWLILGFPFKRRIMQFRDFNEFFIFLA